MKMKLEEQGQPLRWPPTLSAKQLRMERQRSQAANYWNLYGGSSKMTMNRMDQEEIVKSVVDSFKVRCSHRHVDIGEEDLVRLAATLHNILEDQQDNSGMIGGEWDNG